MNLEILYQDDVLVVVNKPSGLLVHRTDLAKNEQDAVVQRLNEQLGKWVYPIHRLDRATSGALVMAFDSESAQKLGIQFMDRSVNKEYRALVRGFTDAQGVIDYPLAKLNEEKGRSRFKIEGTEKDAISHYKTLEQYELPIAVSRYPSMRLSLVNVTPEHGRTHQIRRHFKHIFHPLVGDTRYGCRHYNQSLRASGFEDLRLMLHAHTLTFSHPVNFETITVSAPLPHDFQLVLDKINDL